MRKILLILSFIVTGLFTKAQKVEEIYFNLYTDSLKRGFYNYINVDAKLADGNWKPLDSTQILFSSPGCTFKGNDIFIDSSYKGEKVTVKAVLKSNPSIWKEVTIYIRKRGFDEPLRTNDEILNDMRNNSRKKKKERNA